MELGDVFIKHLAYNYIRPSYDFQVSDERTKEIM